MRPMKPILYVGNKNYSSWSLRPWLVLRWGQIPFEERLIRLDQPGYGKGAIAEVRAVSPSGQVPALALGDLTLWDSLAIAEWAAEESPGLWPRDRAVRALARAATCEMHSGFAPIRRDLPMNIHRRCPAQDWVPETRASLERLFALWGALRERHGDRGPWLLGERSIADAFFTPVATRLRSYSVPLPEALAAYRDTLLADADFRAWEAEAIPNSWDASGLSVVDNMYR